MCSVTSASMFSSLKPVKGCVALKYMFLLHYSPSAVSLKSHLGQGPTFCRNESGRVILYSVDPTGSAPSFLIAAKRRGRAFASDGPISKPEFNSKRPCGHIQPLQDDAYAHRP